MSNLLFEIGTEELPAGFLKPALTQLHDYFVSRAKDLRIDHGDIRVLGTPRRLALIVENLVERQQDAREEIVGPSAKVGLDGEGNFTKPALGFAKSKGSEVEALKVVTTPKGDYLVLTRELKGQPVEDLLPELLKHLILDLTFAKSMRWGGNSISFGRPIQWILALNDDKVIQFEHEGLSASNTSRGHRFMNNHEIKIDGHASYEKQLLNANIIVDPEKRREAVLKTINEAVATSETVTGGEISIDENLVDTVTNLVEIPFGICGNFEEKFLALPPEVLITSMREHQKYFPVVNNDGNLLAGFVAVNNTKVVDDSVTRKGHQRVLRARLEDALFFYNGDTERKLSSRTKELNGIIFQAKLGTMLDKTERIVKLSRMLAEMVEPKLVEDACKAATLCKADLLTDMVGEFPSLQGSMGRAYAEKEGEKSNVAIAISEHYMPKRAGAELPTEATGALVGLADRFDTLAGCFGIGQIPSGNTDPFGLRRISLAILQVIRKFDYSLSLSEVVHKALALYGDKVDGGSNTVEAVVAFIEGRYRNHCVANGLDAEAVAAATSVDFDNVNECSLRIEALSKIKSDTGFSVLASSYKRIRNIIKDNTTSEIDETLLVDGAEKNLQELLVDVREQMTPMIAEKDYLGALNRLLMMKEPVDVFFDEVMVMDEDIKIRQNRLNLLTALGELVLQIGDISKMHEA